MAQATLSRELLMDAIKEDSFKALRVCFVCTGNTCRSPMAEAVANHLAKQQGRDVTAFSRGLYAVEGDPIAFNAIAALENAGIQAIAERDYRKHTAHSLGDGEAETFDLLVGMGKNHAMELMMRYPHLARRILCMPTPIPDPFGGDLAVYETCLAEIDKGVRELLFSGDATR